MTLCWRTDQIIGVTMSKYDYEIHVNCAASTVHQICSSSVDVRKSLSTQEALTNLSVTETCEFSEYPMYISGALAPDRVVVMRTNGEISCRTSGRHRMCVRPQRSIVTSRERRASLDATQWSVHYVTRSRGTCSEVRAASKLRSALSPQFCSLFTSTMRRVKKILSLAARSTMHDALLYLRCYDIYVNDRYANIMHNSKSVEKLRLLSTLMLVKDFSTWTTWIKSLQLFSISNGNFSSHFATANFCQIQSAD